MPTVILAKTVKGYGMGAAGESLNPTHGTKKMDDEDVKAFRDRFQIPVTDEQLKDGKIPIFHHGVKSPEVEYMIERRTVMGGVLDSTDVGKGTRVSGSVDLGGGGIRKKNKKRR